MALYRLYILDERDKIVDRLDSENDEDQAAMTSACDIAQASRDTDAWGVQVCGVEVWAGARMVGKVAPAWENTATA